ncbi:DUF4363 family protein [uncultured Intestinimonas sp.]|uniref:DUF4363 family protein n=1 Tax=uncultured Intestinimonas sp. TaxID=1689265 RepID=UPI0025FC7ED9|nr:DUF4363 family protein [uncultured Intestinimonas sp.]
MRRLWLSLALLVLIFAATVGNSLYLKHLTGTITDLLEKAQDQAMEECWEEADALTHEALRHWQDRELYLYTTLRHADTDEVYTSFREVEGFLHTREPQEYAASNARLIARLELVASMEQFSLQNLL